MIGLHTDPFDASGREKLENYLVMFLDEKAKTKMTKLNYLTDVEWMRSLQCGTYVVDLTTNSILQHDSQYNDRFKPVKGWCDLALSS